MHITTARTAGRASLSAIWFAWTASRHSSPSQPGLTGCTWRRLSTLAILLPLWVTGACVDESHSVPPVLVGSWDGGSAGESEFALTIEGDGSYALAWQEDPRVRDEGYLEVTDGSLTMASDDPGNPVHEHLGVTGCPWEVTERTDYGITMQTLWLCGQDFSYLRGA